jgi:hypothetical protein
MLRRSFQESAILSVTLALTFHSLSIMEGQFYEKINYVKPSYRSKATADCRIPELMKFRYVGHLMEIQKSQKVNLIRQSHLVNL